MASDVTSWTPQLKDDWRCEKLHQVFESLSEKGPLTPWKIAEAILGHAEAVTGPTRRIMEANPKASEPRDFTQSKGKMGHVCCVAIKVGKMSEEQIASSQVSSMPL
jgi:hypothetical protein